MLSPRSPRPPRPRKRCALAALLAAALGLAATPALAAGWERDESGNARWRGVQRAGLGLAAPAAESHWRRVDAGPPASEARTAWQREWRLIQARLLSLGTLPAAVSVETQAAFREALLAGRAPTRFAPDRARLRAADLASGADPHTAVLGGQARSAVGGWSRLHVWAEGAGYAVGRRSAGYGLECGAALSLDEDVDLTAGYRLAGYTLGVHLEAELADVEDRIGTPFVGLDFRF